MKGGCHRSVPLRFPSSKVGSSSVFSGESTRTGHLQRSRSSLRSHADITGRRGMQSIGEGVSKGDKSQSHSGSDKARVGTLVGISGQ